MPCWSHRSETGVCSRRWSRRMATFSWAVNRLRVFLAMGKPPLEIVAYSSGPFFPFRLKQNTPWKELAVSTSHEHIEGLRSMVATSCHREVGIVQYPSGLLIFNDPI